MIVSRVQTRFSSVLPLLACHGSSRRVSVLPSFATLLPFGRTSRTRGLSNHGGCYDVVSRQTRMYSYVPGVCVRVVQGGARDTR